MKTFDIANEYLKDFNFGDYDTYTEEDSACDVFGKQIKSIFNQYKEDKRNSFSNNYYRNMVFGAAVCHNNDLYYKRPSYFNVACEMIESELIAIKLGNFELYNNTSYPKILVDLFLKYCDEMNPQPPFLSEKSEVRLEFFMAAYHYIIDKNS